MPFYRVGGMLMHIKLGGKRRQPPACCAPLDIDGKQVKCLGFAEFLCDEPVGDEGKTCDAPVCSEHATQVGRNAHRCPKHTPKDLFS